ACGGTPQLRLSSDKAERRGVSQADPWPEPCKPQWLTTRISTIPRSGNTSIGLPRAFHAQLEVEMFCVSVVDHVRLNFGHVMRNYSVHAKAGERMSALALKLRLPMLALRGLATGPGVLSLFTGGCGYQTE